MSHLEISVLMLGKLKVDRLSYKMIQSNELSKRLFSSVYRFC